MQVYQLGNSAQMYLTKISTLRVFYLHIVKYTRCSFVESFQFYDTHKVQDDYTFVKKHL